MAHGETKRNNTKYFNCDKMKEKTMHEKYGELDDEIGKHLCCEKCGYCITCGDCKKHGCSQIKQHKK